MEKMAVVVVVVVVAVVVVVVVMVVVIAGQRTGLFGQTSDFQSMLCEPSAVLEGSHLLTWLLLLVKFGYPGRNIKEKLLRLTIVIIVTHTFFIGNFSKISLATPGSDRKSSCL